MAGYRLEPIPTLPTLRITLGNETVGFAYAPKTTGEPWEVYPRCMSTNGLPDGDLGFKPRQFDSFSAVESFLGLAREALVA